MQDVAREGRSRPLCGHFAFLFVVGGLFLLCLQNLTFTYDEWSAPSVATVCSNQAALSRYLLAPEIPRRCCFSTFNTLMRVTYKVQFRECSAAGCTLGVNRALEIAILCVPSLPVSPRFLGLSPLAAPLHVIWLSPYLRCLRGSSWGHQSSRVWVPPVHGPRSNI